MSFWAVSDKKKEQLHVDSNGLIMIFRSRRQARSMVKALGRRKTTRITRVRIEDDEELTVGKEG